MKKIYLTIAVVTMFATSCSPSAEDKAKEEKQRILDSIQLEKDRDSLLNNAFKMIDTNAVKTDSVKNKK